MLCLIFLMLICFFPNLVSALPYLFSILFLALDVLVVTNNDRNKDIVVEISDTNDFCGI